MLDRPHVPNDVEAFLAVANSDRALWQSIEVRLLAVRVEEHWHNLFTRLWLRTEPAHLAEPEVYARLNWLRGERHELPIEQLEPTVRGIACGTLALGADHVRYLRDAFAAPVRVLDWTTRLHDDTDGDNFWFRPFAGRSLCAYGEPASHYWSRLPSVRDAVERDVKRVLCGGFRSVQHLMSTVIGWPRRSFQDDPTGVEMLAPCPVRFDHDAWRWNGGILNGRVVATTPLPSTMTQVRAHATYRPHDTHVSVEVADHWILEPSRQWVCWFRIDPTGESRLTVELRCGTTTVDFHNVRVPLGIPSSVRDACEVAGPHRAAARGRACTSPIGRAAGRRVIRHSSQLPWHASSAWRAGTLTCSLPGTFRTHRHQRAA